LILLKLSFSNSFHSVRKVRQSQFLTAS